MLEKINHLKIGIIIRQSRGITSTSQYTVFSSVWIPYFWRDIDVGVFNVTVVVVVGCMFTFEFVLIMENVVSNPFLVQKILSFLPIKDVQRCQLVNKVWNEEAYRQLIEYPIDYCCVFYEDRLLG